MTKPVLEQPIFDGYILVLQGQALRGDTTTVLFGDMEVAPIAVTASQVTVALPLGLLPGTQSVAVNQPMLLGSPPEPHRGIQSAPVPFTLQPRIKTVTPSSGQIDITLDLAVGPLQTALLLLNQLLPLTSPPASNANAYTFPAIARISLASPPLSPPPPSPSLSFLIPGVASGTYLVRVQVDDAESPLTPGPDGRLVNPQVTIL